MSEALIQDLFKSGLLREGDSVKHFNYTWTKLNLTAGSTDDVQITILSGSDFIVTEGYATVRNQSTKADQQWHPVTIELSDPSENMQNTALPLWHVFGHPAEPVKWDGYAVFKANSTVILSLTNDHGSTAVDIYATVKGLRRWRKSVEN